MEREPEIRIWAPDEAAQPKVHANMKKLADFKGLSQLLQSIGVTEADIFPPLPRMGERPEPSINDCELYAKCGIRETPLYPNPQAERIEDSIREGVNLKVRLYPPLEPVERLNHTEYHNLTQINPVKALQRGA